MGFEECFKIFIRVKSNRKAVQVKKKCRIGGIKTNHKLQGMVMQQQKGK